MQSWTQGESTRYCRRHSEGDERQYVTKCRTFDRLPVQDKSTDGCRAHVAAGIAILANFGQRSAGALIRNIKAFNGCGAIARATITRRSS